MLTVIAKGICINQVSQLYAPKY